MAAVLKSEMLTQGTSYPQPVVFNIEDVQRRARVYLEQIQREASQTLEQARQQAHEIRSQAKADGIADAQASIATQIEQAAQKLSDQRCKTALMACEATVSNLTKETANWLAMWRDQTVELAAKIAEKLCRREIVDREETLRVWMEEAIVAFRDARDIRVMVHPDDFAVAGRFLQQLARTVPQAASVEVMPDPEIALGSCLVRSAHGQIDQQLEAQLQRLVQQLN